MIRNLGQLEPGFWGHGSGQGLHALSPLKQLDQLARAIGPQLDVSMLHGLPSPPVLAN